MRILPLNFLLTTLSIPFCLRHDSLTRTTRSLWWHLNFVLRFTTFVIFTSGCTIFFSSLLFTKTSPSLLLLLSALLSLFFLSFFFYSLLPLYQLTHRQHFSPASPPM